MGVTGNDVTNRSRPWDRVLQLIPSIYNYYSEVAWLPVPHKQFLSRMYIVVFCGVVNVPEHCELCV